MEGTHNELESLQTDSSDLENEDLPSIAAIFLIYFDSKVGYTIGWKRSLALIELEGIVEYKSLPSGLHSVKEDLVYFVHEDYVGLSAFINAPATVDFRNACMISVGVMIPLSHERLKNTWKHAEKLREMASELTGDMSATKVLQDYWDENKAPESSSQRNHDLLLDFPSDTKRITISPKMRTQRSTQSVSNDPHVLRSPGNASSIYRPAWSMTSLLEVFGPLLFPIYRAALLHKRILIMTHAPVMETCNFAGNIPSGIRPLFSVGVHDIPMLERDLRKSGSEEIGGTSGSGWVACTTDKIIATKSSLFDILISVPTAYVEDSAGRRWPKLESSEGLEMRATQRDLRRYNALKWGLSRSTSFHSSTTRKSSAASAASSESAEPLNPSLSESESREELPPDLPETENIIEPISWAALAHSSFMCWASAAEQRIESDEELKSDLALMSDSPSPQLTLICSAKAKTTGDLPASQDAVITTYFRRLTSQIFGTLSDIVDTVESNDMQSDNSLESSADESKDELRSIIHCNTEDVARMGLDMWSAADHLFIQSLASLYFERRALIEQRRIEICGLRVC